MAARRSDEWTPKCMNSGRITMPWRRCACPAADSRRASPIPAGVTSRIQRFLTLEAFIRRNTVCVRRKLVLGKKSRRSTHTTTGCPTWILAWSTMCAPRAAPNMCSGSSACTRIRSSDGSLNALQPQLRHWIVDMTPLLTRLEIERRAEFLRSLSQGLQLRPAQPQPELDAHSALGR